jgi:hypothetical protein
MEISRPKLRQWHWWWFGTAAIYWWAVTITMYHKSSVFISEKIFQAYAIITFAI